MVQFIDGSTLAQCSPPDMKLPIALALSWPERLAGVARPCDWTTAASWTFEPLDTDAFPAVELARSAGQLGGTAPAVFNAANEECVDAFHEGRIRLSRHPERRGAGAERACGASTYPAGVVCARRLEVGRQ